MSGTVEFHDQFQRQTTEIHNGIAQGNLPPKLTVEHVAIAQKLPGELLGQRIRMTELTSTRGQ